MRIPHAAFFVVGAMVTAIAVGVTTKYAAAEDDEAARRVDLPMDVATFGFVSRGDENGVAVLDASRPFEMTLANGLVTGDVASAAARATTRGLLARELGRYPRGFFAKIGLAGVVVTEGLREGDVPIPSLPNVARLMLLDAGGHPSDLSRALHHEIWHFADLADDGVLAPDPAWRALDPRRAPYGAGGRTLREPWAARPSPDLPGFVSVYASTGEEEDKAETFAFLATGRATADDALTRAKCAEIRRRLASIAEDAPRALGL